MPESHRKPSPKAVWKSGRLHKCAYCGRTSGANYCSTSGCPGLGNSAYMIPNPVWEEAVGRNWRESMRRIF